MPLWGNKDNAANSDIAALMQYNRSPANTTARNALFENTTANAFITNQIVGQFGVDTNEIQASNQAGRGHPQHAGWVSIKTGTGPVTGISVSGGTGINAAGYLTFTDSSVLGQGTGANISFTTANSQNTLQTYSTNSAWNTFGTFTINNGGSLYSNASAITIRTNGSNTSLGTFTVTLGGRAGRFQTETLVAMASITLDDPRDNVYFSGI